MKKNLLLFVFFLCSMALGNTQILSPNGIQEACDLERSNKALYEIYPEMQKQSTKRLKAFHGKVKSGNLNRSLSGDVVPIVFHLVTPCENSFDFTKAELDDVIIELNKDFTALNIHEYNQSIDPVFFSDQAAIGITFKLAEIDPNGNPTDGITRSQSFYSNHGSNYQVPLKEIIQWNPKFYLNVWIVQNVATSGYAQYPWTAEDYPHLDGIVWAYDYVGENNINNRPNILTHEIGHWLGLLHTWGDFTTTGSCADPAPTYCDCDDFIDDTPNTLGYNSFSCPTPLPNSCIDANNDEPDNIYNFMDYACEVMFTMDQKTRILDIIAADVAYRDSAVTLASDDNVFLASHPDNGLAKLYTDKKVFTESLEHAGVIPEQAIIELRDCVACSFATDINTSFSTSGLPAYLESGLEITYLNSTQIQMSFNVTLTDLNQHDTGSDILFDLHFNASAINGIGQTSEVFNNASIKGIKIDFVNNNPGVLTNVFTPGNHVIENIIDGDFEGAYIPYVNDYVGFYHYQNSFYMYSASSYQMEAAVVTLGSNEVKKLNVGDPLHQQNYQFITPGYFGGANELLVFDETSYAAWEDQSGYVGVRVTMACGEQFYVWIEISVTNSMVTLMAIGINAFPYGSIEAGQLESCEDTRAIIESFGQGQQLYFDATEWIISNSIIATGAHITFDAGDSIRLEPGFEVEQGAVFETVLEGCFCIPDTPEMGNLSHNDYCTYGYIYCFGHDGDNKEFELTNISLGSTEHFFTLDYFQYITLDQNNDYQYRVRKQCGTTGVYGAWSPIYYFSSCE